MKDDFEQRFSELVEIGKGLVNSLPLNQRGPTSWVQANRMAEYQQWLSSSANLIHLVAPRGSTFIEECDKSMNDDGLKHGVPTRVVQKMYGILNSAQDEWRRGFLRAIEYIIAAETFDDFLDHAANYHKGNKKTESSVLASAVLEDTIKRIAKKNGIVTKGLSLEPLIDELIKKDVFTPVKGKRVKGFAGVRNHAFHAEWDEFDINDVGELIKGVRELIEQFL